MMGLELSFSTRIVSRRYQRGQAFKLFRRHFGSTTIGRASLFYDQGAILFSNTKLDLQV
jgi:hypothetical protein